MFSQMWVGRMADQDPDGERSVKESAEEEAVRGWGRTEKSSRDNITSACFGE